MRGAHPGRRRRGRRRRPLEGFGSIIDRALGQAGLTDQARRLKILLMWQQAVGPNIAARTVPQSFSRGTLVVKAASPTWQNELTYLKAGIMARLNELLGGRTVRELKVIAGPLRREEAPPPPPAPPLEAGPEDVAVATELARCIDDPLLRQACVRAVARYRCNQRARFGPGPGP